MCFVPRYTQDHNMTITELYQNFLVRMMETASKLGRRSMTWDSLWESNATMPSDAIVHVYVVG